MSSQSFSEIEHCLVEHIRREIAGGFTPLEAIVPDAIEIFQEDCESDLTATAERAFASALEDFRREQATWPAETDCDRLDAAFTDLESEGIVCRQNFSCCGTCAAAEIWDEIEQQRDLGREIRGCAHYNVQDTESAVEGDGIYLSYGSVLDSDKASVAIGHEIVAAMKAHGLRTEWDGTIKKRIFVDVDWKRRRPELA